MATATVVMEMPDAVLGNPLNFEHLEARFSGLGSQVRQIEADLSGIRFGTSEEFRGKSANSFSAKIAEVDNHIDDLGDICRQIARIFGEHARQLKALEKEAADALARAKIAWDRKNEAEKDIVASDRTINFFQDQLDSLSVEGDGDTRRRIEWKLDCAYDDRVNASGRESDADRDLGQERQAWHGLREREKALIDHTAANLRSVDLESLADPSTIAKVFNEIGDFADWLSGNYKELLAALYKSLEHLQTIVLVAIVVVVVAIAIVGSGGALSLVVLPALLAALKAVTLAKAVSGVAAWIADPENVSGGKVLLDVASVLLAGSSKALKFTDNPMTKFLVRMGAQPVTALKVWDKTRMIVHYADVADFVYGSKGHIDDVLDFVDDRLGPTVQPAGSFFDGEPDPSTCAEAVWQASERFPKNFSGKATQKLVPTGWN